MKKLKQWWTERQTVAQNKVLRVAAPGEAFVSFTFDDFPVSAAETGAQLLARVNARATFFYSGSLIEKKTSCGTIASLKQASELLAEGHEIGSHTFSHTRPFSTSIDEFRSDLKLNHKFLNENMPEIAISSFSFPFGECNPGIKKIAGETFDFCRGIQPGINHQTFDASYLKSNKIYNQTFDVKKIEYLISEVKKNGGWLIFYTHDVEEECSPFGCKPSQLSTVIDLVSQSEIKIVPVGKMREFTMPYTQ